MVQFIHHLFFVISSNPLLKYLMNTSATVSVIIGILLFIRIFMKKMPRVAMYVLWFVVALRILCPVSINGIYHLVPEGVSDRVSETQQNLKVENITMSLENNGRWKNGSESADVVNQQLVSEKRNREQTTATVQTQRNIIRKLGTDEWIVMIWLAGVILLVAFLVTSLIRTRLKLSDARHLWDNIYTHPLVVNSFVAGIFAPKIYISEKIPEEDREYVLCHEKVHIKRKDYLVKPFMFLLVSVYWFNPLMWTAYFLMMKDMEVSCDEAVIPFWTQREMWSCIRWFLREV